MAFSQESGVQSASTNAAALRAYDGGILTLTGGNKTMTCAVGSSSSVVGMQNSNPKTYRFKLSTSSDMSNPITGTATATVAGSGGLNGTSYQFTGLLDGTTYYATAALDNA